MAWVVREIDLDREIINAIEMHDDRAAAILAALYLEDRINSTNEAHGGGSSRCPRLSICSMRVPCAGDQRRAVGALGG
jgi:hypothetical protein